MTTRRIVSLTRMVIFSTSLVFKNSAFCNEKGGKDRAQKAKMTKARRLEQAIDSSLKDDLDPHKRKRNAARLVVDKFIKADMIVGMGSGPSTYFVIEQMGRGLKSGASNLQGVTVIAVNSSIERHLLSLQIPTTQLSSIDVDTPVDLLIDGADEVDLSLNVLKGNTGSLTREKMLWHSALQRVVLVTEEAKLVKRLGLSCPLPVEISSWGDGYLKELIVKELPECKNARGVLRMGSVSNHYSDGLRVATTEAGTHILDLFFDKAIQDPQTLSMELDSVPGVVSHGLFVGYATTIVVADELSGGARVVGNGTEGVKVESPWWDDTPAHRPLEAETVDNRKI